MGHTDGHHDHPEEERAGIFTTSRLNKREHVLQILTGRTRSFNQRHFT